MNTAIIAPLAVLALVLCTTRETGDRARTWTELWAPARANGWKRSVLLAAGGAAKLLLLITGCLLTMALTIVARSGQTVWFMAGAVAAHLQDLMSPGPIALSGSEPA